MSLTGLNRQQNASARHYLKQSISETAIQAALAMTAGYFDFPMVQLNVVDANFQHTIGSVGTALGTIRREDSLCDQVVREGKPQMLDDFRIIPKAACHIQSYIGVPITGREGLVIGALCLLDTVPRAFSQTQLHQLESVATVIQDQLELLRRLGAVTTGSAAEATELSRGIQLGQLTPLYQPIVDLKTGVVQSVEALARWDHPTRGMLPPSSFVPLAEDSEIIIEVDVAILAKAAVDVARWQRDIPGLRLNANLSARHFDHPDCVRRLSGAVLKAGLSPEFVTLEVTETAALAAHPADRSFLTDLRVRGFRVVLDDFGTGFSAIEQVLRLPVDGIKLDRAVTAALGSKVGDAVVRALVGLAADLRLQTVIEGVERPAQAARAIELGCTHGQGYLWAKPLNAQAMTAHLSPSRRSTS